MKSRSATVSGAAPGIMAPETSVTPSDLRVPMILAMMPPYLMSPSAAPQVRTTEALASLPASTCLSPSFVVIMAYSLSSRHFIGPVSAPK